MCRKARQRGKPGALRFKTRFFLKMTNGLPSLVLNVGDHNRMLAAGQAQAAVLTHASCARASRGGEAATQELSVCELRSRVPPPVVPLEHPSSGGDLTGLCSRQSSCSGSSFRILIFFLRWVTLVSGSLQ